MTTGSIQEKGGMLYAVINLKDINGKRKQKWFSTGLPVKGNKRKAEEILRELILQYSDMIFLEPSKVMLCDFIAAWIERIKPEIQTTTYVGYCNILKKHLYPYFKQLGVTIYNVAPTHIDRYIQTKTAEGLNPNTIIKHCAIIRSTLQYAKKQQLIRENVVDIVDKPSKKKYTGRFYNRDEINALLEIVKDTNIETPVFLAAYFGLRRSEIVGLRWDSIDFSERQIVIKNKAVRLKVDGQIQFVFTDDLKTASSYRSLPLNETMYQYLLGVKKRIESDRLAMRQDYNMEYDDFVCVTHNGNLIKPGTISEAFSKLLKRHGLKHIRFHDLRHSCASLLLSLGYSMKEVQEWLGHSDYLTTANTYAHIEQNSKRNMSGDIGNTLKI